MYRQLFMPALLLFIIVFSLVAGDMLPLAVKSLCYSFSTTLKSMLGFILPLLVFSFVFSSLLQLRQQAVRFVLMLVPMVCLSNFLSTHIAYYLGNPFLKQMSFHALGQAAVVEPLAPLWSLDLPTLLSNDKALIGACVCACFFILRTPQQGEKIAAQLLRLSYFILNRCFIPVLPLFILGFMLKLQHDQVLVALCRDYAAILGLIFFLAFGYLVTVYMLLARGNVAQFRRYIQAMLAPAVAAFSTMSSAAAMPLSMLAAEKNCNNPAIARSVVPATVNIHLVGDCFAIPLFALALLLSFGQELPSAMTYSLFALSFVANKFAVAAVPGGGILVMLPILEAHFGFTPEMLSLITALYIMFDPVITTANVLGNGAFAIAFESAHGKRGTAVLT